MFLESAVVVHIFKDHRVAAEPSTLIALSRSRIRGDDQRNRAYGREQAHNPQVEVFPRRRRVLIRPSGAYLRLLRISINRCHCTIRRADAREQATGRGYRVPWRITPWHIEVTVPRYPRPFLFSQVRCRYPLAMLTLLHSQSLKFRSSGNRSLFSSSGVAAETSCQCRMKSMDGFGQFEESDHRVDRTQADLPLRNGG